MVGKVLGVSVFRQQLTAEDPYDSHAELQELFTLPVLQQYYLKNLKALEPSQNEIDQFTSYHAKLYNNEIKDKKELLQKKILTISRQLEDKNIPDDKKADLVAELYFLKSELEPPGLDYAMFVLPQWKLQLHLYKEYGGGRILWQQNGYEAFDAMHKWLQLQEQNGNILFLDASLRKKFYHHWTDMDHGASLITDKNTISKEFLHPVWMTQ